MRESADLLKHDGPGTGRGPGWAGGWGLMLVRGTTMNEASGVHERFSMGQTAVKAQPSAWLLEQMARGRAGLRVDREDAPRPGDRREDVPVLAALPASPQDARRREDDKRGRAGAAGRCGASSRRFHKLLRGAMDLGETLGTLRKQVWRSLGVSERTLESWLQPASSTVIPGDQLYRLIAEPEHLPLKARKMLLQGMAADAGMLLVDAQAARLDRSPLGVQVCEVTAANGRLAEETRAALADERLSYAERQSLMGRALDVQRQAGELVEALRRSAFNAPDAPMVVKGGLDVVG